MTSLHRSWVGTHPPAGTQVNYLHPLADGLLGLWLFNEGGGHSTSLVRSAAPSIMTDGSSGTFPVYDGRGGVTTPGAVNGQSVQCFATPTSIGEARTTVVYGVVRSYGTGGSLAVEAAGTEWLAMNASGLVNGAYNGTTIGPAPLNGRPMLMGSTYGKTGTPDSRVHLGQQFAQMGTVFRAEPAWAGDLCFGGYRNEFFTGSVGITLYMAAFFGRKLSVNELQSLDRDPYQMLVPPPKTTYFDLAPDRKIVKSLRRSSRGQTAPPPAASTIDRGHPLAQGLWGVVLLNEAGGQPFVWVNGTAYPTTNAAGTPTWRPRGRNYPTGTREATAGFSAAQLCGASSVVLSVNMTGTSGNILGKHLSNGSSDTPLFVGGGGNTASKQYIGRAGAAGNYRYCDGMTYQPGRFQQWAITYADGTNFTTPNVWIDGVAGSVTTAFQTGSAAVTDDSTAGLYFGQRPDNGIVSNQTLEYAYVWARQLAPAEIAWIRAEPYAFFTRAGPKIAIFDLDLPYEGLVTTGSLRLLAQA